MRVVKAFLALLRLYDARLLAGTGAQVLWRIYKGDKLGLTDDAHLMVDAIGPRVIALALGNASPHSIRPIGVMEFVDLCRRYLNLDTSTADPAFIASTVADLKTDVLSAARVPARFVSDRSMNATGIPIFMARLGASQMRAQGDGQNVIIRDWAIMQQMDLSSHGDIGKRIELIFGVKLIDLWRAAFTAFALAQQNGVFACDGPTTQQIEDEWNLNSAVVDVAASKLAVSLSEIRSWFSDVVLTAPEPLRMYVDDPFSDHGLIINDAGPPHSYLLPAPSLFVRAVREKVLKTIAINYREDRDRTKNVEVLFGDELESHIASALATAFGQRLQRPPKQANAKSADFVLDLDGVTVVSELKKQLSSRHARSVMGRTEVCHAFHETYDALQQIAATTSECRSASSKPVVGIILVSEGTGLEALACLAFAKASGMIEEIGLASIEVISWPDLEVRISESSIKSFSETMLSRAAERNREGSLLQTARWKRGRSMIAGHEHYLDAPRRALFGSIV